ncbi:hypothetical protein [Blastopirellula marina]|uniref:Magnetosome protein MamS/MamX domain-containing protein n=1 Tax=Blastopirellula marina DSM 3645 TaxID=314230 RepID=A3ZSN5_9BACT|nr:hypothetical protein [Blastopirellula marina]EAQ80307.1 hypothetical protein DSM3645_10697 [Blastopirellula marina DSM 3645]
MHWKNWQLGALALTATFGLTSLAQAQLNDNQRRSDNISQQDDLREQRSQSNPNQATEQSANQNRPSDNQTQYRVNLDGWAQIATDYDRDGKYDAVETIYLFDLENARKASRARAQSGQNGQASAKLEQRKKVHVAGKVKSLEHKSLISSKEKKVVAKISTDQGETKTVCLGKESKVQQLDLQTGDQLQASGVRARIDGQEVVLASHVSAGDRSIDNPLPQQRGLSRYQGEVQDTRKTTFQGRNGEFLIATVKTKDHGDKQVNLGPSREITDLDIHKGTQIKMLARQGKMNNQEALIAEVIRVNDRSVDIREATKRTLKGQDSQQSQQSDRRSSDN